MSGMFYTLQEAAEQLGKTAEEVKQLVREGKLREFRDGSNLLFKIEEVDALMSETGTAEEPAVTLEPSGKTSQMPLELESEDTVEQEQVSDLSGKAMHLTEETPDILSEMETSDASDGGTKTEYDLTADSLSETGETKIVGKEDSLGTVEEEISEDISLDSFGSGSGLLDLSLQADDTSLGAVLEDIYPTEGTGEQAKADQVAPDAEQLLAEAEPEAQPLAAPAAAPAYIEPEADIQSNAFGITLFLPLLAVVYTVIVIMAHLRGATPLLLTKIQSIIWYLAIGLAGAAIVIIAAGVMFGGKTKKKPAQTEVYEQSAADSD